MASQHNVLHNSDWNDTGAAQVQLQTLWLFTPSMKEIVNAYLLEVEKQQIYTICIIDWKFVRILGQNYIFKQFFFFF